MRVTVERVEEQVLRIHCRTWRGAAVGYDASAYLVGDVLVDTGFAHVRDAFLRAIADLPIRGVLVTHQHEDHAGAAAALAGRLPMHMHPGCEAALRERPAIGYYRRSIWGRADRLTSPLVPFDAAPMQVLELPGHTPDHVALWDPARRILAAGDLFLGVKVRIAHHDEEPAELVRSLRRAAELEPRLLLDAHRGPIANPAALLRAKADWLEATIDLVRGLSARGAGAREITRRVLGREDFVGWVSFGEYAKRALVEAILRQR